MSSLGEEVKDWLVAIVVAVVLAFVIRQFIVELYVVDGPSMRPTLQSRERGNRSVARSSSSAIRATRAATSSSA